MKSIQLLIVACVLYCVPVYAQNVAAGKVLDAHTGKALAGVIVQTQNGTKSVITDNEGNFKINVAPGESLQASHLGFTTLAFQAETYSEVRLSENVNDLSAVTVVGSRNLKRSIDNSPVPVDVIELKSATKTLPQVDLNQMLNYLAPSLTLQDNLLLMELNILTLLHCAGLGQIRHWCSLMAKEGIQLRC